MSEDCLVLNIFTKDSANDSDGLKPVMLWFYGGGLTMGSNDGFFGGFLAAYDVVFVAPNYRLGAFGFLYTTDSTTPGNVGFYDQNLAMKWVGYRIR